MGTKHLGKVLVVSGIGFGVVTAIQMCRNFFTHHYSWDMPVGYIVGTVIVIMVFAAFREPQSIEAPVSTATISYIPNNDRTVTVHVERPGEKPFNLLIDVYTEEELAAIKQPGVNKY